MLHDPQLAATVGRLEHLQQSAYDSENLGGALLCQAQDEQTGIVLRAVSADIGEVGVEGDEGYAGRLRIRSWESSAA